MFSDFRQHVAGIPQIAPAHLDEPLKMEDVASDLGMSVSGFHHHFRSVMAMSPLQYQEQIRLLAHVSNISWFLDQQIINGAVFDLAKDRLELAEPKTTADPET